MIELSGKKILFIGPKYYEYHTEIIKKLEMFGAEVDFYPEMINNYINRFAKLVSTPLKEYLRKSYLRTILNDVKSKRYDMFLLIRGEIITPKFLEELKSMMDKTQFVMYQWDSIVHNNYESKIKYFDKVFTFDKKDAQQYQVEYLPLFYTDKYRDLSLSKTSKNYDVVFFGAYHSDRLQIIKQISEEAKLKNLKFYHHLYTTKFSMFRGLLFGRITMNDLKYLKTFTVPSSFIVDIYSKTKAVLDIEMTNQNGLTIRTLEVLGSNLKLMTTNIHIADEVFFNSERIFVLDRNKIELSQEFFNNELSWDANIEQYYINNWMQKLFYEETK